MRQQRDERTHERAPVTRWLRRASAQSSRPTRGAARFNCGVGLRRLRVLRELVSYDSHDLDSGKEGSIRVLKSHADMRLRAARFKAWPPTASARGVRARPHQRDGAADDDHRDAHEQHRRDDDVHDARACASRAWRACGRKMRRTLSMPAVIVVVPTKRSGASVTSA